MTEFPEGTPKALVDAFETISEKARVMMLDASKDSNVCRGYFMAVCDFENEIEQEVAEQRARLDEAHAKAGKAYLEAHGEPT
jgi:glutamate formiminotransferase